ncbi:hypothetical protein HJFPF1_04991 [Paramyrothecium foliicola]|nr:hypothetical protein HJFPF1_04991 [Paramyrothecium foliicola]
MEKVLVWLVQRVDLHLDATPPGRVVSAGCLCAAATATAAAVAAGEEGDEDAEEGDDGVDDGVEDVADAADNSHDGVTDGAENALDLLGEIVSTEEVVGGDSRGWAKLTQETTAPIVIDVLCVCVVLSGFCLER